MHQVVNISVNKNVRATANADVDKKDVAFKSNAPFRSCITIIVNSTLIENVGYLDIVMPMYNLLEYSQNYSMTSGSLWNYYRYETDDTDDNAPNGKSFKSKTKIVVKTEARPDRAAQPGPDAQGNPQPRPNKLPIPPLNTEVLVPLKYLSKVWRSFDLLLINCEIELELKWTKIMY